MLHPFNHNRELVKFLRSHPYECGDDDGLAYYNDSGFLYVTDAFELEELLQELIDDSEAFDLVDVERLLGRGVLTGTEVEPEESDEEVRWSESEQAFRVHEVRYRCRDTYRFQSALGGVTLSFSEYYSDDVDHVITPNPDFVPQRFADAWVRFKAHYKIDDVRKAIAESIGETPCDEGLICAITAYFTDRETFIKTLKRFGYSNKIQSIMKYMKYINKKLKERN